MRNLALLFSCFLSLFSSFSQETRWEAAWVYTYAPEWDKAIQTYNFSRPFLENQQPLFDMGVSISATHIFGSKNRLNHGFSLSGFSFESRAKNENFDNLLRLGFLKTSYLMHFFSLDKTSGLYNELGISLVISVLARKVNGSLFDFNEGRYRVYGFGGEISNKLGYRFEKKGKLSFSPFIGVAYTPYLFSPNTEVLINQTQGLASKSWTPIFSTQIGVAFGF
jgi:hypothetical protein